MKENFVNIPQNFWSTWIFISSDNASKASDTKQLEPRVRLGHNLAGGNTERI